MNISNTTYKILTIVGILVLGVGIFFFSLLKNETASAVTVSAEAKAQTTKVNENKLYKGKEVYIFVDTATHKALTKKIARLATDIEKDLGAKVLIKQGTYSSPVEIRNILKKSFNKNTLAGSILIGDIPTFKRDNFYTDWFYQDFSDRCSVTKEGYFSSSLDCNTLDSLSKRDVFTGRITSPASGQEGIVLVEKYLDKNHNFRVGNISFPKKLLVYPSIELIAEKEGKSFNANKLEVNMATAIASQSRYSTQETDVIYERDYEAAKSNYLNKLRSNRYETALINIHGSQTGQFPSGAYGNSEISFQDIKNANPNILYLSLLSCSNGAFNSPDYLAGWFLFSGDTLLVTANSQNASIGGFVPDPPLVPNFFQPLSFLNSVAPLGDLIKNDTSLHVTQTLGDPTLRLKNNKVISRLEVQPSSFNFAPSVKSKEITIKNTGQTTATIMFMPSWGQTIDNKTIWSAASGGTLGPVAGKNFAGFSFVPEKNPFTKMTLPPGQSTTMSIQFSPFANSANNQIIKGTYRDSLLLLTSDQLTPYIEIPLTGQQK